MCLVILIGGLILLLLITFVKSALLLLPWTITAAALAGLSGTGLGKIVKGSGAWGPSVSIISTLVLTLAFGYLGCGLVPPVAPPQKQGLEALLEMPEPTQAELWQMLPIHLTIVGLISAVIVGRLCLSKVTRSEAEG